MKTQKKLLIDNVYFKLEEMGVDTGEIQKQRAYDIAKAQRDLELNQRTVRCPFCSRKYDLIENEHRLDIINHIGIAHQADIRH